MTTRVFVDGSIYSPIDPYATAMVANESEILWVGSDAGARSIEDDSMERIELNGDLLVPGFALAMAVARTDQDLNLLTKSLAEHGYTSANIAVSPLLTTDSLTGAHGLAINWWMEVQELPETWSNSNICGLVVKPELLTKELAQFACTNRLKVSVNCEHEVPVETIIKFVQLCDSSVFLRLDAVSNLPQEAIETIKSLGIPVNFDSVNSYLNTGLALSIAAGIKVAAGSDLTFLPQTLGWDLALKLVQTREENTAISARAAFNAMTRGVYRANGEIGFSGQLVPDAPAAFTQWKVTELMVQTADSRVANWSTDPRARIPLLPVLEAGNLPVLQTVYAPAHAK